jgi:hypothetical protein
VDKMNWGGHFHYKKNWKTRKSLEILFSCLLRSARMGSVTSQKHATAIGTSRKKQEQ